MEIKVSFAWHLDISELKAYWTLGLAISLAEWLPFKFLAPASASTLAAFRLCFRVSSLSQVSHNTCYKKHELCTRTLKTTKSDLTRLAEPVICCFLTSPQTPGRKASQMLSHFGDFLLNNPWVGEALGRIPTPLVRIPRNSQGWILKV